MKKIWIFNHYASMPTNGNWIRHYNFAKHLKSRGYDVKIFASSALHNSDVNIIKDNKPFAVVDCEGIDFIYVRTSQYKGNGISRVRNMFDYFFGLFKIFKNFEKPDVIYASSTHPFSCVAGIKIAKKLKIPCICEIRDLWPESIVAYKGISPKNPAIVAMRMLEKWIYKKCDRLIFTMEGGVEYIKEHGWDKSVDIKKISNINNGVDVKEFDRLAEKVILPDDDLDSTDYMKIVYCGSIRLVNALKLYIDAFLILKKRGITNLKFLVFGDGNERAELEKFCQDNDMNFVVFKGHVDKTFIPSIVSRADVNVVSVRWTEQLTKSGCSWNKLFEYFAAGKPIVSNIRLGRDPIIERNCGFVSDTQTPESIADTIQKMTSISKDELKELGNNARNAAKDFDFEVLTDKLEAVIKSLE